MSRTEIETQLSEIKLEIGETVARRLQVSRTEINRDVRRILSDFKHIGALYSPQMMQRVSPTATVTDRDNADTPLI